MKPFQAQPAAVQKTSTYQQYTQLNNFLENDISMAKYNNPGKSLV